MSIKKKNYTITDTTSYRKLVDWWTAAADLLGADWSCSDDGSSAHILKNDSAGSYGWLTDGSNGVSPLRVNIAGVTYTSTGRMDAVIPTGGSVGETKTCVVWEGTGGSVGIGFEESGRTIITLVMAKFDGHADGNNVYALGNRVSDDNTHSLLGNDGLRIENGINMTNIIIGSGVYLHSLLEPSVGLSCSDVMGVQCFDGAFYGSIGTIARQGGVSYMSVLGNKSNSITNVIFVKM